MDIRLCNCSGSAFQAAMVGTSLSAGRDLWLWRLLPFRQKWAGELKAPTAMNISVFEGIFGLKSRIFITAAFSLRHESSSETCLKGSTFICHEGAKTRSWLRPQNIITPVLPDGGTCPLILRGLLYGKCDPTPLLR